MQDKFPITVATTTLSAFIVASCTVYSEVGFFETPTPVITGYRVLAIRTDVTSALQPEPDEKWSRAQALPFETVEITPFIVDEFGVVDPGDLDVLWLSCEGMRERFQSECLALAFPLTLAEIPDCPVQGLEQLMGETLPESVSPCLIGRKGTPDYVVPLSAALLDDWLGSLDLTGIELTMIASIAAGTSADECATQILNGSARPQGCLHSTTYLDVGPLDSFMQIAADLGLDVPEIEASKVVSDGYGPVRNPRISEFRVTSIDDEHIAETMILKRGEVIRAPLGARLNIEIEFDVAGDLNSFDSEGWYRTWGEFPVYSEYAMGQNEWTIISGDQDEPSTPPGGRAWLYYVVRDGWFGIDWFWFGVEPSGL